MQLPDNTRDPLPDPASLAGADSGLEALPEPRPWRKPLAIARRVWHYAPQPERELTWPALQAALVRTLACGVLLFAMLAAVRPAPYIDLYPTYVAAQFANEGRWGHIYHRSVWLYHGEDPDWDRRVLELTGAAGAGTSYVYHPFYLQLVRPIAKHVSWAQFQVGWVKFSKCCVVAAGLGISLLLGFQTFAAQALVTLVLGISGATLDGIELGQNVLPALVFSLGAVAAWGSRTPLWLGGLCALLAWVCKPWCATLLLLCFLLRGTRAGLVTSLAIALLMMGLPTLVLPAQLMHDYRDMTLAVTRISVDGYNNLSLLSVLERFANPDWSKHLGEWIPRAPQLQHRLAALGSAGLVLVLGAGLWWRRRPSQRYTIAAYLAFMLLPLGICWTHYFVFALPLALVCAFAEDSPLALRAIGIALLGMLLGLMVQVLVSPQLQQHYLVQPQRYPWRYTAPVALLIVTLLGALALAPRAREGRA